MDGDEDEGEDEQSRREKREEKRIAGMKEWRVSTQQEESKR